MLVARVDRLIDCYLFLDLVPESRRAPGELPEVFRRAPRELPEGSQRRPEEVPEGSAGESLEGVLSFIEKASSRDSGRLPRETFPPGLSPDSLSQKEPSHVPAWLLGASVRIIGLDARASVLVIVISILNVCVDRIDGLVECHCVDRIT